jgi:Lrp/AsnC family leucine-responsive transcriptional regulator
VQLDGTDVAVLKSLMTDGRKSFRAIAREIKVSTPTVKRRYERLMNMGLIIGIKPEIDLSKVDRKSKEVIGVKLEEIKKQKKHFHVYVEGITVKLKCDFCGGPIHDRPNVLKFANIERFFCCTQCRASYKEKNEGRIEMLKRRFRRI